MEQLRSIKEDLMANPDKGKRKELKVRAPVEIVDKIVAEAAKSGCSSVSQYASDVLCRLYGRPDLVRELNQEVLPLTA